MSGLNEALRARVERCLSRTLSAWTRIERGYTPAERWVLRFSDSTSAFAKVATTPLTAQFLRAEAAVYEQLEAPFMPRHLGFEDDAQQPLLLLEDLSSARWPPPWHPGDFGLLQRTLRAVASVRPLPASLPTLAENLELTGTAPSGWSEVLREPGPLLALGLCSPQWLEHALPVLLRAEQAARLDGDDLVHNDVRSDNVCVRPDRLLLIDWNWACRGNGAFDLAFAAPSLCLEGGPLPEELVPDGASLAAVVSGFFAARAGLPVIVNAPRVRWIQIEQLRVALPWAARVLGLSAPT